MARGSPLPALCRQYPAYYRDVRHLDFLDVYAVHRLFGIEDPSGALQHASKKLLLSGTRTGGKTRTDDIREARDTLTRWLELQVEPQDTAAPPATSAAPWNGQLELLPRDTHPNPTPSAEDPPGWVA